MSSQSALPSHRRSTPQKWLFVALVAIATMAASLGAPLLSSAATTSYSLWPTTIPANPADREVAQLELGTRFTSSQSGRVSAVRFYKSSANTGVHTGSVWDSSGRRLASVTFRNETTQGWQSASLTQPVSITAGRTYVVSYTTGGRYAGDQYYFANGRKRVSGPLTATAGLYRYGSGLPTSQWRSSNYYVDVAFSPASTTTASPTVTASPTTTTSPTPTPTATTSPTPTPTATTSPTPTPTATTSPTPTASPTATSSPSPTSTPTATPTPTPTPTPTTTAPTGGFPSASTTGVPAGTALTASGSLTISTPGAVVSGLDVRGTVTITASNVTFRNSRVRATGWNVVKVAEAARGVVLEDVELDGSGTSGASNSMGVYGPATVRRANIHGVENGVTPFGGSLVEASWIHNLAAPGSPHYDGIQIDGGGSNITIRGNFIDMREHGQTAAVMVDNYFGGLDNISVTGNRLLGGGYTVYCDGRFNSSPLTRISYTNNRISFGHWGHALINDCNPSWSVNVDDVTGHPIDL